MKVKGFLVISALFFLVFSGLAFCESSSSVGIGASAAVTEAAVTTGSSASGQDQAMAPSTQVAPASESVPSAASVTATPQFPASPEMQWLWGEVLTVDSENKAVTVKYLDYESDQEKQISIAADEKTTLENINSFVDIKPGENLSIDYMPGLDGKNIAKNITLEKAESEVTGATEAR